EERDRQVHIAKMMEIGFFKHQVLIALHNRGLINPESIDEYIGRDGYTGAGRALTEMSPMDIIEEMIKSGLRGRGGAGFPTGLKWKFANLAQGPIKYMLCNGDEGDPGAFMDRSVLEADPHAVIEGMIIGGKAIGASKGFIYVRAEYPLAIKRLQLAIKQAREYGLLGEDILGSGFNFNIELYFGAGAFVCGEETALMRSIEGKRGMPRPRPPFPAHKGLWDKPSVLNNVETLANIPQIISRGAEWFASLGTEKSKGTKIFAVSGCINNVGLIEVPMGITLRTIVYDICGGIKGENRTLKAVQVGGPSGGCIPSSLIDTPVDYESIAKTGAIMGSGGMVVMDDTSCMVDVAKFFLGFTAEESCGKCTPCRVGTKVLLEKLEDITAGRGKPGDIEFLQELSSYIIDTALCGLGQTAPNPILTTIKYFREEYEAHINDKWCPTGVCKRLSPAPCQKSCPIGQDVPSYVALIGHKRFGEAFDLIRKDNPFPMSLGRVCVHFCETTCKRGTDVDTPISICGLKRFVADREKGSLSEIKPVKVKYPDKKVAVIGAGPSGLTCAHDLANRGYAVTVFESLPVAGGMLRVGIPEYRLPRDILDAEINAVKALGVEIQLNSPINSEKLNDLVKSGYKAIYLAIGAHSGVKLKIEGEDTLAGFYDAVKFLREINLGQKPDIGKNVAVIGGGNTAMDAARTALRCGCNVTILYRRTREEMPAGKNEIEDAIEEGVKMHYLVSPVKIIGDGKKLTGIELLKNELGEPDSSGRRRPVPIKGSEFTIEVDNIFAAISQTPQTEVFGNSKLELTRWNSIEADSDTLRTSIPYIFSGGDATRGPSTVVEAMADGQRAAVSIHKYLQCKKISGYKKPIPRMEVPAIEVSDEEGKFKRPKTPQIPVIQRANNYNEVDCVLSEHDAVCEARRCLRCDL
ncbi:MAG: NADH-quinone oxidoreductase subunit NuoF, partial [bacterium]